jgi:uncharacterized protein with FMN-binding domain
MKKNSLIKFFSMLGIFLIFACSSSGHGNTAAYTAGSYTAVVQGMHAPMKVQVTFSGSRIESIAIPEHDETKRIGDTAIELVSSRIVHYQSLGVDNVSGATVSSMAIKQGVARCVEQAGGDPSALQKVFVPRPKPVNEVLSYDVVVVGGGLAGLSAAVAAANNGASVALIEKEDIIGGTSVMAEGYFFSTNNSSPDGLYNLFIERGQEKPISDIFPNRGLLRVLADNNTPALDMIRVAGLDILPLRNNTSFAATEQGTADTSVRTAWRLIQVLSQALEKKGGVIYTGTPGTRLLSDGKGGVRGVYSQGKLGDRTFNAKKVILACGDFANNRELLKKYAPQHAACYTITAVGNTGDGMTMALELGAVPYPQQYVQGGPLIFNPLDICKGLLFI